MLCVKNLNFKIDGRQILKDFSLSVKPGELVVITGPNGGGKSTIAQVLMGIKNPDSGQIVLDGQDITKLDITERAKAGVALSFQQPVHFKGVKVKDLLGVALTGEDTVYAENLDNNAISDALFKVGLKPEEYLDREVNNSLSGGELKRIEVASVLVRKPKLLIFDEPEAGIDIWSFDRLVKVFQKLRKRNCAIIVISHQKRLMAQADRIVVLKDGQIANSGPATKMLEELEEEQA